MTNINWNQPTPVTDVDVAFPAHALEIMPSHEDCQDGLNALPSDVREKWVQFQRDWFYKGLPATLQVALRTNDGVKVDGETAFRHLRVIQGSYAPKHEHKVDAVAFLCSQWFQDFSYEGFETYEFDSVRECIAAGKHSTDVDEDGYCNLCGDSPVEEESSSSD